ncbi:MAG: pilus assembly protein PilM [Candidatus Magasanikbacteria bacterium]|nr:pilus assembly protein PilM [Candidatus Magasanikbacteria bacterium]
MSLFGIKSKQYIGIDIGSGGIKLVELREQNKRPYLHTYAFSDVPVPFRITRTDAERAAAVETTAAMIKEIAAAAKTVSKSVVASLPQRDVFSTIINIPKADAKTFNAAVAHEIEKLLPFPLAEAQLDTRKIEPLPSEVEMYKKIDRGR